MKKRLLSIALCLCMVLTLLPTMALAETDIGPVDSIAAGLALCTVEGDTFTVDGVTYTYGGDVTDTGLTLDTDTTPAVETTYEAGTGTIVWTPAGEGGPAKLTLNNASTQGSITVPAAMVVEKGKTATVNSLSDDPVILTADAGFTNNGTLIINSTLVKIATTTGGFTNEGTINIVNGEMLDLSGCDSIAFRSTGAIVNNGNLGLPASFPVADLDTLRITGNGVVTIGGVGGVTYAKLNGKWMQDVGSKGLDISVRPDVETTYKAGTGTVTFTPATIEPAANAKLVFDGATIAVSKTDLSDATAITLPNELVDVSFRGTNSISGSSSGDGGTGTAFSATAAVTFTLEEGSTTTLTAAGETSKVISSTGDVTIDGSGALNLKPMVNPSGDVFLGYAIHTTGAVAINGGTVCEQRVASDVANNKKIGIGGIEAAGVTLGTFTIPAGGTLDLHNATMAGNIPETVTNKGTLILPDGTAWNKVPAAIGGVVVIDGVHKKAVDKAWALDVTTTGLDISYPPAAKTVYTAGEGTITYDPTAATLTLNNATIAPTTDTGDTSGVALLLGTADIKLVLEGSSSLKGFNHMAMCGDTGNNACGNITISGTGSLTLYGKQSGIGSFYADSLNLIDSVTVTSPDGTVTGTVKRNDATLNAVLTVGAGQKVYGKHTIAENEQKSYTGSVLEWVGDANMEVNGLLTLAYGTEFDAVKSHLTGSGIVRIMKSKEYIESNDSIYADFDAYRMDGTPMIAYKNGLLFDLSASTQGANWKEDATLEADGYEFKGNSADGYTLTLGNLLIDTDNNALRLPGDGPVTVVLESGTYTYLSSGATASTLSFIGGTAYPRTITGSGRLLTKSVDIALEVSAPNRLIISGGDISAYSDSQEAVRASSIIITGGTLTAGTMSRTYGAFKTAPKFSGYIPRVSYGADAASATTEIFPASTVYTKNKFVQIEEEIINYADNYTLTFDVNGGNVISSISKTSGTTVDLTTYKPTKTGYTFDGWYSDSKLTDKVTSIKLTKNTTVYAKWTAKTVMTFEDVPEDAYYNDAVIWAVENGITEGTSAATFSPDAICTRAQAVTFLWRAAGSPAPKTTVMPFNDVPVGSYYYNAVLWAVEQGIIKGTSETTFSPDMNCSRAHIVTILWRMEGSKAATTANPFADVSGDAYYADAVLWAVDEDITKGTSATTFSPDDNCTRAQIVTFLYRDMK